MSLFEEICNETFVLIEGVSNTKINKAINGMHPVTISYDDGKGGNGKGLRTIYPVAFGLTSAENPVIRAFQPSGDTKRGIPKWKYFRVDRIKSWDMNEKIKYDGDKLEGFMSDGKSKSGDDSMSVVYNIAPIGNARFIRKQNKSGKQELSNDKEVEIDYKPITKQDVEGIDTTEPKQSNEPKKKGNLFYSAKQVINNLINRIRKPAENTKPTIDNSKENVDTDNSSMTAPETKPVNKQDIVGKNDDVSTEPNNNMEQLSDEPISKEDINGEDENELTTSFNDMMNRMNNLNKEEKEQ